MRSSIKTKCQGRGRKRIWLDDKCGFVDINYLRRLVMGCTYVGFFKRAGEDEEEYCDNDSDDSAYM